jgi:hypothetical protein
VRIIVDGIEDRSGVGEKCANPVDHQALENPEIAKRHLRAFLLQRYHEARLPALDPSADSSLFSVLGRVSGFCDPASALNIYDFKTWLHENSASLAAAAGRMLPEELSALDRKSLIASLIDDVLMAVANAIGADLEHPPATAPVQGNEVQDETEGSELESLR